MMEFGHPLNTLTGHELGVISLAVSKQAEYIFSSSFDGTLRKWDLKNNTTPTIIELENSYQPWMLDINGGDEVLLCGRDNGKLDLFGTQTNKLMRTLDSDAKFLLSAKFSPNGKLIGCGAENGIVTIFDVETGEYFAKFEAHAMGIRSLCFSQDSLLLLTTSEDGQVRLFDYHHSDTPINTISAHKSWVLTSAFHPSAPIFATGSSDKSVKVWDIRNFENLHFFDSHKDQVCDICFDPLGQQLVSVSDDQSICFYRLDN
ncbi:hypothetical protein M0811_07407 [Anaeramoeba ignava]|uniref:Uncharacterized protein n=1 Tax=Anaeramoeba ignava TaxID=1746090 RepID=A0A9Q0LM58_ANAIG|nr:hypothetical protein M0811_07407 [Anaeramoeba ignava]